MICQSSSDFYEGGILYFSMQVYQLILREWAFHKISPTNNFYEVFLMLVYG